MKSPHKTLALALLLGCGAATPATTAMHNATPDLLDPNPAPATLVVTLPTVQQGVVPNANVFNGFGCSGENHSLPIGWSAAPTGTQSFAVIMHDPDAPTGVGFFHWLVFNLPATTSSLNGALPAGAVEGFTDFGNAGYGGPCPPPGAPHRYIVTVYALDVASMPLGATSSGALTRFMLREHTLALGRATVTYGRAQ